jgi:hypothetical protein
MFRTLSLACLAVTAALLACKKREPVTAPDAAAPIAIEIPEASAPPATAPVDTSPSTPTGTPAKPQPKPATKDAGAKDAATTAQAEAGAGPKPPSKECLDKCNAVLSTCLTPSAKDGGFPSLADPTKCQQAFQACTTACK